MDCCARVRRSEFHCAVCHRSFTNLALFDAHQNVDYGRKPVIICRHPLAIVIDYDGKPVTAASKYVTHGLGLRLAQTSWGTWGTPQGVRALHASAARISKITAARRATASP